MPTSCQRPSWARALEADSSTPTKNAVLNHLRCIVDSSWVSIILYLIVQIRCATSALVTLLFSKEGKAEVKAMQANRLARRPCGPGVFDAHKSDAPQARW